MLVKTEETYHGAKYLDCTNRQDEADAYLKLGWQPLYFVHKREEDEYAKRHLRLYVLGWVKDSPPARPKGDFGRIGSGVC
jgi:hypothetical protein